MSEETINYFKEWIEKAVIIKKDAIIAISDTEFVPMEQLIAAYREQKRIWDLMHGKWSKEDANKK